MIRRRQLLTLAALLPWMVGSKAAGAIPRIGLVGVSKVVPHNQMDFADSVAQQLQNHGMVRGRDYVFELRYTGGSYGRSEILVKELVDLKVDLIMSPSSQVILAAKRLTTTIPIVFVGLPDPVGLGVVSNLPRPGSNLTGSSAGFDLINAKQLETMAMIVPKLKRLALLVDANNNLVDIASKYRSAADRFHIKLLTMTVDSPAAIDKAYTDMQANGVQAAIVIQDAFFAEHAKAVAQAAIKAMIPTAASSKRYCEVGLLFSIGDTGGASWDHAADYVVRILRGAKPGDLPVQQPVQFTFVINKSTAQKLKLNLPSGVLLRADEVLE